jgi:hypothetical protein
MRGGRQIGSKWTLFCFNSEGDKGRVSLIAFMGRVLPQCVGSEGDTPNILLPIYFSCGDEKDTLMKYSKILALSLTMASWVSSASFAQTQTAAVTPRALTSAAPSQLQVPVDEAKVIMIRASLMALSQANQTNNYAVLAALSSPSFQMNNPPAKLTNTFEAFRANKIDLAPISLVMPQLAKPATIENGRLRMVGFFPTQPMQVNFDLMYEPAGGLWKLHGMSVNLQKVESNQPAARPTK